MPALALYLEDLDVEMLHTWFSEREEFAYVIYDGNLIRATRECQHGFGSFTVWHVPSGGLPLVDGTIYSLNMAPTVADPWSGWTPPRWKGADPNNPPRNPYFGPSCPVVFSVDFRQVDDPTMARSEISWIGDRYRRADPVTHGAWSSVSRFVRKVGVKQGEFIKAYAFPRALQLMRFPRE